MNNLLVSLEVIVPLLLMMLAGYWVKRRGILDDKVQNAVSKLIFQLFLPLLLFLNVYQSDLSVAVDPVLLLVGVMGTILTFLAAAFVVRRFEPDVDKHGVLVQGTFRANCALFGMPVAILLCGEGNVGTVAMMLAVIVPLLNVLAVLSLTVFEGGTLSWKKILKTIVTNPLIISVVVGLIFNLLGIELPKLISVAVRDLSRVATPLSFIILGASFTMASAIKNRKRLIAVTIGKLLLMPLFCIGVGTALGLRGQALIALMVVTASPTSSSSYPMTREMGGDYELAGEIIVFTSIFSIATVFLWIFGLKELGLI